MLRSTCWATCRSACCSGPGAGCAGWRVLPLIGAAFVVSAGFETLQFVVPDRHPSTTDLLLNTLGAAAGVLLARLPAGRRLERQAGRMTL